MPIVVIYFMPIDHPVFIWLLKRQLLEQLLGVIPWLAYMNFLIRYNMLLGSFKMINAIVLETYRTQHLVRFFIDSFFDEKQGM